MPRARKDFHRLFREAKCAGKYLDGAPDLRKGLFFWGTKEGDTMEDYKERLSLLLAKTGALFFDEGLVLKDGRPTPYFVNMAMFRSGRLSIEMGSFFAAMMVSEGHCQGNRHYIGAFV